MGKVRTTLAIDDAVLRAVKVKAARTNRPDSQVIEEALRRDLGFDLMDQVWRRNDLTEDEAMSLADEAKRWARRKRR
ncbi:MAG TPA: ribbon-helix-helix protein, CopG family [Chloroflexota bacterium]|jgi:hypothetical protein|nr:ribbon-helix-helix protein, CopG family [Chloroflexota bacterium]